MQQSYQQKMQSNFMKIERKYGIVKYKKLKIVYHYQNIVDNNLVQKSKLDTKNNRNKQNNIKNQKVIQLLNELNFTQNLLEVKNAKFYINYLITRVLK